METHEIHDLKSHLDHLLKLSEAATPGPWLGTKLQWNPMMGAHVSIITTKEPLGKYGSARSIAAIYLNNTWSDPVNPDEKGNNLWQLPMQENLEFILSARTSLPALVKAVWVAVGHLEAIREDGSTKKKPVLWSGIRSDKALAEITALLGKEKS